jgi:hypothetical protein
MILSHGLSFVLNYIGNREYLKTTPDEQIEQAGRRVRVLQLAIINGGFGSIVLRQPLLALVALVILKSGLDLRAHLREATRQLREA